jgi:hypothetical protein
MGFEAKLRSALEGTIEVAKERGYFPNIRRLQVRFRYTIKN